MPQSVPIEKGDEQIERLLVQGRDEAVQGLDAVLAATGDRESTARAQTSIHMKCSRT